MSWQEYCMPASVDEALKALASYRGQARVVAGGTDLLLEIQQGHRPPVQALVDVTRITGAAAIQREGMYAVLGCGVTHTQIVNSDLIQQHGTALAEGCCVIGGPQVRNVATLAGNIAHALPAGDGTIALLALGGEAQVARLDNSEITTEWAPLEKLYLGPGQSYVDPTREVIAALRFIPTEAGEGSAFARIMRPQGVALPILGMAARVRVEDGIITAARIAVGPVTPTPLRARAAESALIGRPATPSALQAALPALLDECHPRTSPHRSTAEYRREILSVLLHRAVGNALDRAGAMRHEVENK